MEFAKEVRLERFVDFLLMFKITLTFYKLFKLKKLTVGGEDESGSVRAVRGGGVLVGGRQCCLRPEGKCRLLHVAARRPRLREVQ